ncbi:MAG: indole-3-glycerol phosphate synthase TrpC [Sphaerochaeta sp.]|nr:indole-3-glycerol phosphate synthase TrpC [Sphaerochaeta sp.]
MDILQSLAEGAKQRYEKLSEQSISEEALQKGSSPFSFRQAVAKAGLSLICEVKKASPSKGIIDRAFPYLSIAKEYEAGGSDALSVLTEPSRFLGNDKYLQEIAAKVSLPVLRKDFIVTEYQIYEAKILGSSAVLLICALLSDAQLERYLDLCETLGMDALVEAHDGTEVRRALRVGAKILGVNNRDLRTFEVDLHTSLRLRDLVPPSVLFVSESGITGAEDARLLETHGVDAILVGELLMRSCNKAKILKELRG